MSHRAGCQTSRRNSSQAPRLTQELGAEALRPVTGKADPGFRKKCVTGVLIKGCSTEPGEHRIKNSTQTYRSQTNKTLKEHPWQAMPAVPHQNPTSMANSRDENHRTSVVGDWGGIKELLARCSFTAQSWSCPSDTHLVRLSYNKT